MSYKKWTYFFYYMYNKTLNNLCRVAKIQCHFGFRHVIKRHCGSYLLALCLTLDLPISTTATLVRLEHRFDNIPLDAGNSPIVLFVFYLCVFL